jgi:hypothetical protein
MEAVVVTQDHKPNLEQERGAARLAQEELFWEEGVAYLSTQPHDGLEVQRLALSRSLGDFDLTGRDAVFAQSNPAECFLCGSILPHPLAFDESEHSSISMSKAE